MPLHILASSMCIKIEGYFCHAGLQSNVGGRIPIDLRTPVVWDALLSKAFKHDCQNDASPKSDTNFFAQGRDFGRFCVSVVGDQGSPKMKSPLFPRSTSLPQRCVSTPESN